MTISVVINLAIFSALIIFLYAQQKKYISFTKRVFTGLGLGVVFGGLLQLYYGAGSEIIATSIDYFNIVGQGYVKLLQMIIIPLVMVSIISAILKLNGGSSVGKISAMTIGTLVFTTSIAALVGIVWSNIFGLTAEGLTAGVAEAARGQALEGRLNSVEHLSFAHMIIQFIPANPFLDMTGSRSTSTIATVIFSVFIGISATGVARKNPEVFASFEHFMNVAKTIVMRMVTLVLRLTPYGVMALMTKVISGSNYSDIINLANFVMASYGALFTMFAIHLSLVALVGINPLRYLKKIIPLLTFAFTSRSSAASIPLNVATQEKALGVSNGIANFAASFGSTIGQNGCAGIYPAMLAVMIAPTLGINPMDPGFIATLVAIITISSFGVAGIGGGATFAALIVLSAMDFPVALAGLLISIEPLIDMGRTALNVSGSAMAGTVTSKLLGETDMSVFNKNEAISVDGEDATA
ncbi:L-cystine transporter [Veronia pacifica]|uniref:Sodium:dicarboxylate symporter n=1 Tax=Veronia pacifica TaxID=1080227 RepID=A0A1C3EJY8_9GAMM|nr:L-cystine transporter [Veronia pacifica]ODA33544.1 sodium:dicarboxylate symporter [Veronia pacifica]